MSEFGIQFVGPLPEVSLLLKIASEEKGYGLFALGPINSGTEIGIYTGKLREIDFFTPTVNPYCLLYPKRACFRRCIIDAFRIGSLMRFLNHSEQPNVGVSWEKGRVLIPHILTIRDIAPNEELVISYGDTVIFSQR